MAAYTGRIVLRREAPAHALQQALLVEQEHRLDLGLGQGQGRVGREPHAGLGSRGCDLVGDALEKVGRVGHRAQRKAKELSHV